VQIGTGATVSLSSLISARLTVPGSVTIMVTPPMGQTCHAYPGPGDLSVVEVVAGEVSVISYTCQ
jgi:hypothetical protein